MADEAPNPSEPVLSEVDAAVEEVLAKQEAPKPQYLQGEAALLFGKWDLSNIEIRDAGLKRYINLDPVYLPHTSARHANRPFAKSHVNLVDRKSVV